MDQRVEVGHLGPHEWAVTVTEGLDTLSHRVTVSEQLLDDLGIVDVDEAELVRQTLEFLLERRKATEIPHEFDLDEVVEWYDEYLPEIRLRLAE